MEEPIEKLVTECRKGKRTAQLEIYKRFAQQLYIVCLRITGNIQEAEEAMQDSFLKAFTRLEQFHDGQSFGAWLHRIAVHTAIDYVRKKEPVWEELSDNYVEPVDTDQQQETEIEYSVAQIKEATKKLPGGYRIILSLYLFEGYDMEEISAILNIQPASVRSQYLRAKRKLLQIISVN